MRNARRLILAFAILACPALSAAQTDEDRIAIIRALFAEQGRAGFQMARIGPDAPRGAGEEARRRLRREPLELLRESVDRIIKQGTQEERAAALYFYMSRVRFDHDPVISSYHPMLLDLLKKDDLAEKGYTVALLQVLEFIYPSRESLFAILEAEKRAPNAATRFMMLQNAEVLCGIDVIGYQFVPGNPLLLKKMSDLETWFARNRDRIRFTKDGDFRLSGGEAGADQPELSDEDRKRIRENPVCVLQLMSASSGTEDPKLDAKDLAGRCGAALFGVEGARVLEQAWAESSGRSGPWVEAQAGLSSLAGQYPFADAWVLSAIYVVAYESDTKALEMARDALIQVSPSEIKRIAKGEPRWVSKKARDFANPEREGRKN